MKKPSFYPKPPKTNYEFQEGDRIHLHGIFFGQKSAELVRKHWNVI